MTIALIHLSDIHYRSNWEENHDVVFRALFKDLDSLKDKINAKQYYLILSGDIVQSGDDANAYKDFIDKFDSKLSALGIPPDNRICVPGNHDVSTPEIKKRIVEHDGVLNSNLDETKFNNYVDSPVDLFNTKFSEYLNFEYQFTNKNVLGESLTGDSYHINENIGVFCVNSAYFSSGGIKPFNKDHGKLPINTRKLNKWTSNNNFCCKILLMHHPLDWTIDWSKNEIETILMRDFTLCLSGHSHDSKIYFTSHNEKSFINISAPPLFTNKHDVLGYSIIQISSENQVSEIMYRQWAQSHRSFVSGCTFSGTDDGIVKFKSKNEQQTKQIDENNYIDKHFENRLNDSLISFSGQPKVWVEPILSKSSEQKRNSEKEETLSAIDIIEKSSYIIIKAPQQFGLTCLSHHIIQQAWNRNSSLYLYLDSSQLKASKHKVNEAIIKELEYIDKKMGEVKCVILDSWNINNRDSCKLLNNVCSIFESTPVIVMETVEKGLFLNNQVCEVIDRNFEILYLWSMSKKDIRTIVSEYNDIKHIGEEDKVLSKVVSDLSVLNIHRTPLNCITILKASEIDFEDSPVNRTEMLKRVLFLLFNANDVPSYKTKPDMKDCEQILGFLSEKLLIQNIYTFTETYFNGTLSTFCDNQLMDLNVQLLFEILYRNRIIIAVENKFCFRFTYWLYYFAAQRMHNSEIFANYIFKDKRYAKHPEIIEFYTGIDRKRNDALQILSNDLETINKSIKLKFSIPDDINPFKYIQWVPSNKMMEQMKEEVENGIKSSNLPVSKKDKMSDKHHDWAGAYNQGVRDFISDNSINSLMFILRASARALRNSDYAKPENKRAILKQIVNGWKELTKTLLIILPILAKDGRASIDGAHFTLASDFGDTIEQRLRSILVNLPFNVVSWYQDDIFSQKLGTLLKEHFNNEEDDVIKHELIILMVKKRPRGWQSFVEKYIVDSNKNSFYLHDVMELLRSQYKYSYASTNELKKMERLIKMTVAKHQFGVKKPSAKTIKKVKDTILPNRQCD